MRILVTGASGKAGKWVVRDLVDSGHDVLATDLAPALPDCPAPFTRADLTDYGQTIDIMRGIDAVAHLANIPAPDLFTDAHTINTNNAMNTNVFLAAADRKVDRVVWASSETTLGLPFDQPPDYAPVDERHPLRPESSYALSKVLGEEMARQFSRWSGLPFIGLRFSNVMERADYEAFPSYWEDPRLRKWNLWGYVDESHAAQSVRQALSVDLPGANAFIIAAADTVMRRPSRELMAEFFPGVPVDDAVAEHGTLLAIDSARRVLGYDPAFSWRELF
jgi:nucleoside-diphosphate-sugar epimerase